MSKTRNILSIDGGGIRGIIPAMILNYIEKETGKRIADIFDVMAGSSTGGLIVAGLCKDTEPRYTSLKMVQLFEKYGPKIFNNRDSNQKNFKYSDNLEKVLHTYFKENTLADTSKYVIITSYDIHNNQPFLFNNWKKETRSIKIKDALRAAMAVPTLFLPKELKVTKFDSTLEERKVLVDGSMSVNNPAAFAYGLAERYYPDDRLRCISIGTGITNMHLTNTKDFTKEDWFRTIRQINFSTDNGLDFILESALETDNYIRIDGLEPKSDFNIDNVSAENIVFLKQEAEDIIHKNSDKIKDFCNSVR